MGDQWTAEALLEMVRGYHPACVVIAAAELDVFTCLHGQPMSAGDLAERIQCDPRATVILLDALTAMRLLVKHDGVYEVPAAVAEVLTETGTPMNCQEMIQVMAGRGYWSSPGGKTPAATLYSAILRELQKKGNDARFVKAERGKFVAVPGK